jgi:predicted  nucleic acid-binding Zn-ribbon protein
MAAWLVERRLSQVSTRLRSLREELSMIDEQLDVIADDAENQAIRALVAETPGAEFEANDARKHADAMRKHRDHVATKITELEQRQDELLDRLSAGSG